LKDEAKDTSEDESLDVIGGKSLNTNIQGFSWPFSMPRIQFTLRLRPTYQMAAQKTP
jgi:hypothetical protein